MIDDDTDMLPMDADLADLDRLESYLDDALDPPATAALRVRLTTDLGLATTLAELRSQRSARRSALALLEPDDAAVQRFAWRMRGAIAAEVNRPAVARRPRWAVLPLDPWRLARVAAAAAACVVLGFLGGRIGRGNSATIGPAVAQVAPSGSGSPGVPPTALARGVDVPITDEYNRVISNQHFGSQDEAQRFLDDLRHASGDAGQPVDGQTHLASEIKY